MGFVTCSKCKKIYDYEKNNGICPKCARYNKETSAAQDHQEYHDKYDGGYSHTEQDNHHSYHQRYDNAKNPHSLDSHKRKTDKKTKVVLGIIFGIIAINILFSGGLLLFPIVIGLIIYFSRKKK